MGKPEPRRGVVEGEGRLTESPEPGAQAMVQPSGVPEDPWAHRSEGMKCRSCMFYVPKADRGLPLAAAKGRCRRHAPTMGGYPVVFPTDWCGDHKLI